MKIQRTVDGFEARFSRADLRARGAINARCGAVIKWWRDLSPRFLTPSWDYPETDCDADAIDRAYTEAEALIRGQYVVPSFQREML